MAEYNNIIDKLTFSTWQPTCQLRWEKIETPYSTGQVLQQLWQSDTGGHEWRDIEVVEQVTQK